MQNLMQASSPLSDKEIIKGVRRALAGQETRDTDRADLTHRINLYRNVLRELEDTPVHSRANGNALEDEQYCFPCGASPSIENEPTLEWTLRVNKPG